MSGPNSLGDHLTDVGWLKDHHQMIHPFGLGFIQLKIDDAHRMHFWHPDFKREREEVHDHRYNFTSHVLRGALTQEFFRFEASHPNTHELFRTDCKPGKEGTQETILRGHPVFLLKSTMVEGSVYDIHHSTLHRVDTDFAVTWLRRGPYMKDEATVVRLVGETSTCPFAEKMTEDEMWDIVRDCLKRDK